MVSLLTITDMQIYVVLCACVAKVRTYNRPWMQRIGDEVRKETQKSSVMRYFLVRALAAVEDYLGFVQCILWLFEMRVQVDLNLLAICIILLYMKIRSMDLN